MLPEAEKPKPILLYLTEVCEAAGLHEGVEVSTLAEDPGSNPRCVECACPSCACVGFLQMLCSKSTLLGLF